MLVTFGSNVRSLQQWVTEWVQHLNWYTTTTSIWASKGSCNTLRLYSCSSSIQGKYIILVSTHVCVCKHLSSLSYRTCLVVFLKMKNIAVKKSCGVHLDPCEVWCRTKLWLWVGVWVNHFVSLLVSMWCSAHAGDVKDGDKAWH